MDLNKVQEYFDGLAPQWDTHCVHIPAVIEEILDKGGITDGKTVLDVACGTGILFDYYLKRKVSRVTAVDLSPEMVKRAREKYPQAAIDVICGDIQTLQLNQRFDCIMVYNAFPHFADPDRLIQSLVSYLAPKGRLTIAHGSSREEINACHTGSAKNVSIGLMAETELAKRMGCQLNVDTVISDREKYIVSGCLA